MLQPPQLTTKLEGSPHTPPVHPEVLQPPTESQSNLFHQPNSTEMVSNMAYILDSAANKASLNHPNSDNTD